MFGPVTTFLDFRYMTQNNLCRKAKRPSWEVLNKPTHFATDFKAKEASMTKRTASWANHAVPLVAAAVLTLMSPFPVVGQTPFLVYSGAGADASSIAPVVDAFRNVLGANNGNLI